MTNRRDLIQHLSDACVRSMIAALVLSVLAVGISDKLSVAPAFEAYARVQLAWGTLKSQFQWLLSDDCWRAYENRMPAQSDPLATTIAELKTVRCRYSSGTGTGIHLSLVTGVRDSASDSVALTSKNMKTMSRQRRARSAPPHTSLASSRQVRPMAPKIVEVSSTEPIAAIGMLQETLGTLWSDKLLKKAAEYNSAAAKEDIYRWEVSKAQIDQQLELEASRRSNLAEPFVNLSLREIRALVAINHPPIGSLDEAIQASFRASLPDEPLSVDLTTAALATALGVSAFMIVLAAYVRAGIRNDAHLVPGTIFHALMGSSPFESFAIAMLLIPPASEIYLLVAEFRFLSGQAYVIVGLLAGGAVAALVAIVRRLWSYMALRALFVRGR